MPVRFLSGFFVLLLINFCLAEDNFEISGEGGNLLHLDERNISFWSSKIFYRNNIFENEFNFRKINSDVYWLSTEFLKLSYSAKFDFNIVRPKITGGFLNLSSINFDLTETQTAANEVKFTNGGAKGFYAGSELGFSVQNFEITSSFTFARGKFEDGDFQFFWGKPDIPRFLQWGLSLEYDKRHKLSLSYKNFDLNIINNIDMPLFLSNAQILSADYKYSLFISEKLPEFYAYSGFAFADFSMNGALTPANQRYMLFPYIQYNLSANVNAFAVWAGASTVIQGKHLKHRLKAGFANIFHGDINRNVDYEYKRFFGGEEGNIVEETDLSRTGFGFLLYAPESPRLRIANRVNIYFGMRKVFAMPWGTDKFAAEEEEDGGSGGGGNGGGDDIIEVIDRRNWLKTILLSGLSGSLRITF